MKPPARELGISDFVSLGNKIDVSGNDLLRYWADDPDTRVVLMYLESIGDPRRFARIARTVSRRMPLVALKAGRSTAGQRGARSHTAALAADDAGVDALFAHTGVIRADTLDQLLDVGALLVAQPAPAGRRVALIGNAGGPLILAADAASANGLEVVELSSELRGRLRRPGPGRRVRRQSDRPARDRHVGASCSGCSRRSPTPGKSTRASSSA